MQFTLGYRRLRATSHPVCTAPGVQCGCGRIRMISGIGRLAAGALLAASMAFAATAHAQTEVPNNWPLKPADLAPDDEFRFLLVTKRPLEATSSDISSYDDHVQANISERGHAFIRAHAAHFKVLGSTATTNARSHTGTTGTDGVSVFWLRGAQVATSYSDFFDGSWTNKKPGRYQDGIRVTGDNANQLLCTGTSDDGSTTGMPLGGADPDGDGISTCTATKISISTNTLSGAIRDVTDPPRYLALSDTFRITDTIIPVIESVELTSDSGDDKDYATGDEVEITVTFSEAVDVTGTPRISLRMNGLRWAGHAPARSTSTELVFTYTVTNRDYDLNGISLPLNGLDFGGGTVKRQSHDVEALLEYVEVPGGPDYRYVDPPTFDELSPHRVNHRPVLTGVRVSSQPAVSIIYTTGETITIDVSFDNDIRVVTNGGTPTFRVFFNNATR